MLEVAVHAGTEHLALDPELAGLFLGQGVGAVLHPEGLQRAVAVGAAEVVALRAAAVVEDAFAAMPALDGEEFLRHLADRRVPVDGFVAAIGAPAHRRVQAVGAVLVVVHALRFLADVALRGGWSSSPRILLMRPFSVCTSSPQLRLQRIQAVFFHCGDGVVTVCSSLLSLPAQPGAHPSRAGFVLSGLPDAVLQGRRAGGTRNPSYRPFLSCSTLLQFRIGTYYAGADMGPVRSAGLSDPGRSAPDP